jgi:Tfp pilus assembly protein PilW
VRHRDTRGASLVELLVGTALALAALGALTAAIACGGRLLVQGGARGELEDVAHIAVEALTFDVRRAGYDPTLAGVERLVEAAADRLTVTADLDGNGAVDGTSEETVAWVCAPAQRRLSRIVGRQSMPLADGVTSCAFRYLDAGGAPIVVPPAGLAAIDRARVRAIALDLDLTAAPLHAPSGRRTVVALRGTR